MIGDGDRDKTTPVPAPRLDPNRWGSRTVDVISLIVPLAVVWFLCLASPWSSMSVERGALVALVVTVLVGPAIWLKIRNE